MAQSSYSPLPHPTSPPTCRRPSRRRLALLLPAIIGLRLLNAYSVVTYFQPDEFFQALEPAWRLAFGPGSGAWITWEWHHQLRSSLHPALFALAYLFVDWLARILSVGYRLRAFILLAAPKALQSVLAALGDWYSWKLANSVYGSDKTIVSYAALMLQLSSPWQWFVSTRTFSNSLESSLTVAALYYWPLDQLLSPPASPTKENPKPSGRLGNRWRLRVSICLATLAIVLRPTNALIWGTIYFVALLRLPLHGHSPLTRGLLATLLTETIGCGLLILGLSTLSDWLYYGFWTFPPYNWLNFNISKSLAVFYGRNPSHYYLSQGLPIICSTSLPLALAGLYRALTASSTNQANMLKALAWATIVTVAALSLVSHKEVRFIYPLLPMLNVLAAPAAAAFFVTKTSPPRLRNKIYLCAFFLLNFFLAAYLSRLHQPAPLAVQSYLRQQFEQTHPSSIRWLGLSGRDTGDHADELFALFLMPCHSTPWRSHLMYPDLKARALSCEPPLETRPNTAERDNYRDEADRFYDDPVGFLSTELFAPDSGMRVPRYIVGFQGIEPWLQRFLESKEGRDLGISLRAVWRGFNGFFHEDWRRAGKIIVWETGALGKPVNAPPP